MTSPTISLSLQVVSRQTLSVSMGHQLPLLDVHQFAKQGGHGEAGYGNDHPIIPLEMNMSTDEQPPEKTRREWDTE